MPLTNKTTFTSSSVGNTLNRDAGNEILCIQSNSGCSIASSDFESLNAVIPENEDSATGHIASTGLDDESAGFPRCDHLWEVGVQERILGCGEVRIVEREADCGTVVDGESAGVCHDDERL